ncbi:hypothetical protein H4219_005616 [Mycoemilia scoparia]|uniref:Uncharacterized protein n=1 Tax=Mycoemilia scoparia TaxID=417184 RepID=A0A9W7ZVE6_9FUNG|nr:hypothetical protein H4219_005616 [Mycoemilia scoparia]
MSQGYQSLPSKISDLSKDQLNRIISYLPAKGFNSFKLTYDEQNCVDPEKFRESMKGILKKRRIDYIYATQPYHISDYGTGEYYYQPNAEEIAGFNERYNQVENFFSNTLLMMGNITRALDANKPQDEDLEDVKEAHQRCIMAVHRMWYIEMKVHFNGCFDVWIVSFLEEFAECVLQFGIVTKGRISLLGYKNPVLIKSKL